MIGLVVDYNTKKNNKKGFPQLFRYKIKGTVKMDFCQAKKIVQM